MFADRSPSHRRVAIALLIHAAGLLGADMASAGSGSVRDEVVQAARLETTSPTIGSAMPAADRWAFKAAFRTAAKKVQVLESCGDLFTDLDLTGIEALGRTRYELASSAADAARCRGRVSAVTSVRGSRTRLCDYFKALSHHDKAAILIHEALHAAGLSEWPHEPEAPTSSEITARVKRACAL